MAQVEYLVVAGGGGGGNAGGGWANGGGGAGGLITSVAGEYSGGGTAGVGSTPNSPATVTVGNYTVTVGSGGNVGANGGDSSFGSFATAVGGGRGNSGNVSAANSGGSGGGGGYMGGGGAGTTNQGWRGGPLVFDGDKGGGGGGAGNVGGDAGASAGNGGAGLQSSITGNSLWYAGGGGGTVPGNGTGGSGVGGNGNSAGTDGRGGGGGGLAKGGSGIVVIRYKTDGSDGVDATLTTGGTKTTSGIYTIHTFTTSGTFSVVTVTYIWVGGTGNWLTAANWSPAGFLNLNTDTAEATSGVLQANLTETFEPTLSLETGVKIQGSNGNGRTWTIREVLLKGGTIETIGGNSSFVGTFEAVAGYTSFLNVASGSFTSSSTAWTLRGGGTLEKTGTLNWGFPQTTTDFSGVLLISSGEMNGPAGTITFGGGVGVIRVNSGGTFNRGSSSASYTIEGGFYLNGGTYEDFGNNGTIWSSTTGFIIEDDSFIYINGTSTGNRPFVRIQGELQGSSKLTAYQNSDNNRGLSLHNTQGTFTGELNLGTDAYVYLGVDVFNTNGQGSIVIDTDAKLLTIGAYKSTDTTINVDDVNITISSLIIDGATIAAGVYNQSNQASLNGYVVFNNESSSLTLVSVTTTPNVIKSSTTVSIGTLKKNDFLIGVSTSVDYGPTVTTGFWNGISPPTNGYTVYAQKISEGPSIRLASNDSELITIATQYGGTGMNTIYDALNYFNGNPTYMVTNINYPNIVTSGLTAMWDGGFVPSYPRTGTTWSDLSGNAYDLALLGGPVYSGTNGGGVYFDGVNDTAQSTSITLSYSQGYSLSMWFEISSIETNGGLFSFNGSNFINFGFTTTTFRWETGLSERLDWSVTPVVDQLYNITCTYDPNTSTSIIYQDATQRAISTTSTVQHTSQTAQLKLDNSPSLNLFNGVIYNCFFYTNKVLSPAEVTQNYNALKGRFGL